MKKIALALLVTLGAVSIKADDVKPVSTKDVTALDENLEKRIRCLNLSDEEKGGVIAWAKEHKALTATIIAGVAVVAGIAIDHWGFDAKGRTAVLNFLNAWIAQPVGNAFTYTKDGIVAHPYRTAGVAISAIIAALATYDLTRTEDQSQLKKLYKSLTTKKEEAAA